MTQQRPHPSEITARSYSRFLTEKVSRIDAYLLGYLRNPTEDRLEYMTFLLRDWLNEAPKYSLDSANISYEVTPTPPDYRPLFPVEHYNEEREKEKAAREAERLAKAEARIAEAVAKAAAKEAERLAKAQAKEAEAAAKEAAR